MLIKTVLNKAERFKLFIYRNCQLATVGGFQALIIDIKARRNSIPECPKYGKQGKEYDTQPVRLFEFVSIWAFKIFFRYAPRKVVCPTHGINIGQNVTPFLP